LLILTNFPEAAFCMPMKQFFVLVAFMLATKISFAQGRYETIRVSGNCGMCARIITNAAKEAGATEAKWDRKAKVLKVRYEQGKTSNDAIQKKIAAKGYDTEKYAGDEKAYKELHECCRYNNKRINLKK
jgi:mercuric ion binding protein